MPKLYVVATPIGNLSDLTPRMRDAIEAADLIAAEDTRVTMKLLNHWDIKKALVSCHRHNEDSAEPRIVERMLAEDLTVALTCDAGTPGISDHGCLLVRACWEAGISVEPIPGPSAVVTALSVSGFDAREFAFYGFLPREKKPLREKLAAIHRSGVPVAVLYESPHRVRELVERIAEAWPGCGLCVCSDLTKRFERIYRGAPEAVKTPTLLFSADGEEVVLVPEQKTFISRLPSGEFCEVKDAKHEIYMSRDEVFYPYMDRVIDFFESGEKA